jgi:hypothetical protein
MSARESLTSPAFVRLAAAGVFLGGSALAIYAPYGGRSAWGFLALAAFVLFHVACGFVIGRWWALLLPALVVLIAIPSDADHDVPFWGDYLIFFSVPAALLLGIGVLGAKLAQTRDRSRLTGSPQT